MVTLAIVGVGGWGKNLVRNFSALPDVSLMALCDLDERKLRELATQYSPEFTTSDFTSVLAREDLDAVVIATSAVSHYALCKQALEAHKDVYVEKPFVLAVEEGEELVALAKKHQRILMVGHLLEYHPVITSLREMISQNELGQVLYLYSQRLNLGTVREDENALWNFAPHDISSMLYLIGQEPIAVSANGQAYLRPGVEDIAFLTMRFADNTLAHIHVSWLDPHKTRRLTVVGDKQMAVFDDLEATEKLRIFDKGADRNLDYDSYAEYISLRTGDIRIPHIKMGEPLRIECQHFIDCVRNRNEPKSDGNDGLRVVRVLEAADRSLRSGGALVDLTPRM